MIPLVQIAFQECLETPVVGFVVSAQPSPGFTGHRWATTNFRQGSSRDGQKFSRQNTLQAKAVGKGVERM